MTSRISDRIAAIAESATLAVDAKAKALKAAGRPVIGFGAGEPDFPTPDYIVEAAVAACRYPPLGIRGAGYGSARASGYGLYGERYRDTAADNLLVICQIESVAGVEAVPEIAKVPGVDVLFLGTYDLSGSIGKLGRFDDPEVRALIDRAERAILESGLCYGSLPGPLRTTAQLVTAGCRFILAGCDTSFVRKGALAEVASFRALAGRS